MTPTIIWLFLAVTMNNGGTVDSSQSSRMKTEAACIHLKDSYDASMREMNDDTPYAFRLGWASRCERLVLAQNNKGV